MSEVIREFKADCGCEAHLIKWSSKRNMLSMKNCPLHKAAPDLLTACKDAMSEALDSCHSEGDPNDESMKTSMAFLYRKLKAAIAKAEGRP